MVLVIATLVLARIYYVTFLCMIETNHFSKLKLDITQT